MRTLQQRILRTSLGAQSMFLTLSTVAVAQIPEVPRGCDDPDDAGVVVGQVVDESTGRPSSHHFVSLMPVRGNKVCVVLLDSEGHFVIRNVPPGEYKLIVSDQHPAKPIALIVDQDTASITATVRPVDLVALCNKADHCRPLLQPNSAAQSPDGVNELEEVGYRTAIAVALTMGGAESDWVPCIAGENEAILAVLSQRVSVVVSVAECETRQVPDGVPNERLVHIPSGRLAYGVAFSLLEAADDRAEGLVTVSVAPLWASVWHCFYNKSPSGWRLDWCSLKLIS